MENLIEEEKPKERYQSVPKMVVKAPCEHCNNSSFFVIPVPVLVSVYSLDSFIPVFRFNGICYNCNSKSPIKFLHPLHAQPNLEGFAEIREFEEYLPHLNASSLKLKVSFQSNKDQSVKSCKTKRRTVVEVFPLYIEDNHASIHIRRDTIKMLDEGNRRLHPHLIPFLVTKESGQRYARDLDYLEQFDLGMDPDYTNSHRFETLEEYEAFRARIHEMYVDMTTEKQVLTRRVPYNFDLPPLMTAKSRQGGDHNYEIVAWNGTYILIKESNCLTLVSLDGGMNFYRIEINPSLLQVVEARMSRNNFSLFYCTKIKARKDSEQSKEAQEGAEGGSGYMNMRICSFEVIDRLDRGEVITSFEYTGNIPEAVENLSDEVVLRQPMTGTELEDLMKKELELREASDPATSEDKPGDAEEEPQPSVEKVRSCVMIYKITSQGNVFERLKVEGLHSEDVLVTVEGAIFIYAPENETVSAYFFDTDFDFAEGLRLPLETLGKRNIKAFHKNWLIVEEFNLSGEWVLRIYQVQPKKGFEIFYEGCPGEIFAKYYFDHRNNLIPYYNGSRLVGLKRILEGKVETLFEMEVKGLDNGQEEIEIFPLDNNDNVFVYLNLSRNVWWHMVIKLKGIFA